MNSNQLHQFSTDKSQVRVETQESNKGGELRDTLSEKEKLKMIASKCFFTTQES